MIEDRVCARCGRSGVPPRCRYHDGCLSGPAGPASPRVAAFDTTGASEPWCLDTEGVQRALEARWTLTSCGGRVWTSARVGSVAWPSGHACSHVPECVVAMLEVPDADADDAPRWHGDLTTVQDRVTIDHYRPYEAAFPEVMPRGGFPDPRAEDEETGVPVSRAELIERLAHLSSEQLIELTLAAQAEDGQTRPSRTPDEAQARAHLVLRLARERGWVSA